MTERFVLRERSLADKLRYAADMVAPHPALGLIAVPIMREAADAITDLLSALERLTKTTWVDRDGLYHCEPEAWRQAHDAIARALPKEETES